jgi:SHS2 domain-containing protein
MGVIIAGNPLARGILGAMQTERGYNEIQHTADWELEVWAPDLPGLFEQAARGMCALQDIQIHPQPRLARQIEITAPDCESLLVKFLNELLYQNEHDGLGFDAYQISVAAEQVQATVSGAQIAHQARQIKAVTYHNLEIRQTARGFETRVVFDV